jgi:serine/threonine protein kinase
MADRIGQQLGNYRLNRLIGSGGFADVYLGTHVYLDTPAAVKLLQTHFATSGEIEKFRAEARTIAALQHPHIVRLLDFGVEEGMPYLALVYAPNGSLRQHFPPGSQLPPTTILPAVLQVAEALQYAHDHKLVHRDVKPENLLLGPKNDILLTDFGIATVAQNTSQQRTEGVAGTAAYMAPEQLQGKPRPASDLYALGIVVYEWLCGERPFQGGPIEVATQQVLTPPPPLREKVPDLPEAIEQVVLTALAKDPKDRFGSVRAFATAFAQAAGAPEMLSTFFTRPDVPPAPAGHPETSLSGQDAGSLSSVATRVGTPPTSQNSQDAINLATTRITPHLTPQLSNPDLPTEPGGQTEPLFSQATTLRSPAGTPPLSAGAQGMSAPSPSHAERGAAHQASPGADTPLLSTTETAYRASGPAAPRTMPPRPHVPAPPAAHAPGANTRPRGVLVAAVCLLVLVLIGAGTAYGMLHTSSPSQPGVAGVLTATSAAISTAISTPQPTARSTPQPTATPTPQPTATPTPQPTATPTPQPLPPGNTWTLRSSPTSQNLYSVAWSGGQFVAVGAGGTILTSPDGSTWTARPSPTAADLIGVAWVGSRFVAVGYSGTILSSPDGSTWTPQPSPTSVYLWAVAWSGGKYVIVGHSGTILTSTDAHTWSAESSPTGEDLYGVTWTGAQFVAVGDLGAIITSPDGSTWTARSSPTSVAIGGAIVRVGAQFVVVGDGGTILTSPDGSTWTARPSPTSQHLGSVAWVSGQAVIVGNGGTILTSPDSSTWTPQSSPTAADLIGVIGTGSGFVAVGRGGTIVTSP